MFHSYKTYITPYTQFSLLPQAPLSVCRFNDLPTLVESEELFFAVKRMGAKNFFGEELFMAFSKLVLYWDF